MMLPRIRIFTVHYHDPVMLEHFIHHHLGLGVDEVHVAMAGHGGGGRLHGAVRHEVPRDRFSLRHKQQSEDIMVDRVPRRRQDWDLWADVDEMHEYPWPIRDLVARCDRMGHDAITGLTIDHLSPHRLPSLLPIGEATLWQQFPVMSDITGAVLGSDRRKVMATRAGLRPVTASHHECRCRHPASHPGAQVHHFKWHRGALGVMRDRQDASMYGKQCEKASAFMMKAGQ